MREGLVVVGGSYAAVQTAAAARQGGYQGPIRLLTEEDRAPYQRPPLSKGLLTGAVAESALPIRADAFYREHGIEVHTRTHVRAIERDARRVMCEDGRVVAYDRLALATGARPRALSLPGAQLEGVLTLRTLADARALKEALACAENVVVIGGGFIGLEVAASAASLGRKVTVLELQDRLLARACPPGLASWFAALHAQHGVQIVLGARVAALKGDEGRVRAVALEDGSTRAADLVLAGIGVVPNAELAQACGLPCADGIVVDRLARTADARIVAAGDCTRYPSLWSEAPLRLESVQNAMDQARTAGATLAGRESPYDAVPWFWSDQYDTKLQMAGLSQGYEASAVRGVPDEGKFTVYYFRAGRIVAADSVSRPGDHMLARKLVAARPACTPAQAADAGFDLKALLAAGA